MAENYKSFEAEYMGIIKRTEKEKKALWDKEEMLINMAIAKSPDKQPFDIKTLANLVDLSDDDGRARLSKDRVHDLRKKYYLDKPLFMTLEELADHLKWLEGHSSG